MRTILLIIFFISFTSLLHAQQKKYHFYAEKMGSPFMVIIGDKGGEIDSLHAASLFNQSIQLVDSLNHILSDYDSTSELSTINKNAGIRFVAMHPIIEEILLIGKNAYDETNGQYNLAIGPLSQLWRKARKTKVFPEALQVKESISKIDFEQIKIDTLHHQVLLSQKGMQLDLGSLGKGYVAQKVINFLKGKGVEYALVDAGGKIVTCAPDTLNWSVGINQIREQYKTIPVSLNLQNQAVATSGDLYQFFIHKGHRYSHIIHPQTGYGIEMPKNVTVIAEDGITADWLSTACSILTIKEALALAAKHHAQVFIAMESKGGIRYYHSKGWNRFLH